MHLLDSLAVGPRTSPNRVMFGPHETNLGWGRSISDRHRAYYEARAIGGAGLIVTEEASVHESDWPYERAPLASDSVEGWAAVVNACRPHGSLVIGAIGHAGGQGSSAFHQRPLWSPSDEPEVNTREVPKIMEDDDIAAVINGFAHAAKHAVAADLDGVEVNAGQHSLLRQFLSGLTNRRDDRYGEDRTLLLRQVLEAVRSALGQERVLGLRLSCDELAPWAGLTPEAAAELASDIAPMVDYLVVVRGSIFTVPESRPTLHHGEGFNLDLVGTVRSHVVAAHGTTAPPVFAQGSIVDVGQAAWALDDGRCDGVEMTRAQIADPDLVSKVAADRTAEIRPCVLCNQWCKVRDNRNPIIACIADPRAGHETLDRPVPVSVSTPAADPHVLVIGAGPAGLEAARVAASAGCRVRLVERSSQVGGMARVAAAGAGQARFTRLIEWLETECRRLGVVIETDVELLPDVIEAWTGPVIIATGSIPSDPSFALEDPGLGDYVVNAADVLALGPDGAGLPDEGPVLVWDPLGQQTGVAIAELLAESGRSVSLCTPDAIAGNMLALSGDLAGSNVRLQQKGVTILRRSRLRSVGPADGGHLEVSLQHSFTSERSSTVAAAIVDCGHRLPEESVWESTGRRHPRAGDVVAPRTIGEAIREGREAALALVETTPQDRSAR